MAVLNGAWIDIIGDEEPGSSRTTGSQERGLLGNILQQLLYLASTAAKVVFVFDIMVRQRVALRRMSFSMIPQDTLYSTSIALAGWHGWVAAAYSSSGAII